MELLAEQLVIHFFLLLSGYHRTLEKEQEFLRLLDGRLKEFEVLRSAVNDVLFFRRTHEGFSVTVSDSYICHMNVWFIGESRMVDWGSSQLTN